MTQAPIYLIVVFFLLAAWFAWKYYDLRKRLKGFTELVRAVPDALPRNVSKIEALSNAVSSLQTSLQAEVSRLNSQNERLSTVLEQLIDGVIIVDANGLVQFANPAAQRLFETSSALGHSVTEVIRNHQLV
jgi:PAS domain-containing protein